MVGCHRNMDDKKFRNFCMPNTKYDELAIWTRKLGTNASVDETLYFTGGYGKREVLLLLLLLLLLLMLLLSRLLYCTWCF
jgi:hypothetical protein